MNFKCKCVIIAVSFLASTFDLICNWLLYYELSGLQDGIVFGPLEDIVLKFLLIFSIIGCVVYIVDQVMKMKDASKEDYLPLWSLNAVTIISIWIESVPLAILNVYIAGCREDSASVLQLAKALAATVTVLTILGVALHNHWHNKARGKSHKKERLLKVLIGIGLTIVLIGSVSVLALTQFFIYSKNVILFTSPRSFNPLEYDLARYFNGAGIYMNFDSGEPVSMTSSDYIKLTDLSFITNGQSSTVVVSVTYNSVPNTRVWVRSTTADNLTSPETGNCYSTLPLPISKAINCDTGLPLAAATISVVFKFTYQSGNNQKPLGDVLYNYRVTSYTSQGDCVDSNSTSSLSLSYYKAVSANATDPLVNLIDNTNQYYSIGSDLQGIAEAWQTGRFGCRPTGRALPRLDTSVDVPCLKWGSSPLSGEITGPGIIG